MNTYNFEEFKVILKTLLFSFRTENTFADKIERYLNGEDSFFWALNSTNDLDDNIKECNIALNEVLGLDDFAVGTYETVDELFDRYRKVTRQSN